MFDGGSGAAAEEQRRRAAFAEQQRLEEERRREAARLEEQRRQAQERARREEARRLAEADRVAEDNDALATFLAAGVAAKAAELALRRSTEASADPTRAQAAVHGAAVVETTLTPTEFARAAERERIRRVAGLADADTPDLDPAAAARRRAERTDDFRAPEFDTRTTPDGRDTAAATAYDPRFVVDPRANFRAADATDPRPTDVPLLDEHFRTTTQSVGMERVDAGRDAGARTLDGRPLDQAVPPDIDGRDVNARARTPDQAVVEDARARFAEAAEARRATVDPAIAAMVDQRAAEVRETEQLHHEHGQRFDAPQPGDPRFGGGDPRAAFADPNDPNHPDYQLRKEWDEIGEERAADMHASASRVMSIHTFGGDDGRASDQAMGEGVVTAKGTTRAPDDPYARYRGAVDKAQQELAEAGELDTSARRGLASGRDPYMVLERHMAPGEN